MDKANETRLLNTIESLADNVRSSNDRMKALMDAIDDLRVELEHAVRNGTIPPFTVSEPDRLPESVACCHCDAHMDSPQEAVIEGWLDLAQDDGPAWNFLGICPACQKEEMEAEAKRQQHEKTAEPAQKELFGNE